MAKPSVEQLMAIESRLNWSLAAAVTAVLCTVAWAFLIGGKGPRWIPLALLLAQFGCYVWFAVSVGAAARVLEEPRWGYVTWILVAPVLALIPIPIVSQLIGASPLSVKFLLGGRLAARIRERAFED